MQEELKMSVHFHLILPVNLRFRGSLPFQTIVLIQLEAAQRSHSNFL